MRLNIQKATGPVLAFCVLGGFWLAWHLYLAPVETEPAETSAESRTFVELPEEKLKTAGIELGKVELRTEAKYATVPGRVTYDETRHVDLRVATAGVITKLLVRPGDSVEENQLLAVISSPEVGSARADSLQRASELELATRKLEWEESRGAALEKTVAAIEARESPSSIRTASIDQQLGLIREQLLTAYSNFLQSESLISRTQEVANSGALSGKTSQERQSQFESASSSLQATIEQSRHDTLLSLLAARAATDDALRRYNIAVQQVATLLGNTTSPRLDPPLAYVPKENLSLVEVRAPLAGTIEQWMHSETERTQVGDSLFVLANTSTLWIKAQARESQWSSLTVKPDDTIQVTLPAFQNEKFDTSVCYLGREVELVSNSIPIILSIDNSSGRLRPGLFARVHLPLGEPVNRLAIPESALAQHEGESFVFRPIAGNRFERVDVQIRTLQDGWAEVTQGLQLGEQVVVRGTFTLKSELLLESEE